MLKSEVGLQPNVKGRAGHILFCIIAIIKLNSKWREEDDCVVIHGGDMSSMLMICHVVWSTMCSLVYWYAGNVRIVLPDWTRQIE